MSESDSALMPTKNGLYGRCPRCQKTTMFERDHLKIKKNCEICDLDYSFAGPADGPSYFTMLVMMTFTSLWVSIAKVKYDVSLTFIIVTTLPFLVVGTLCCLRFFRAWLVSSEYVIKSRDGRIPPQTP